MATDLFSKDDLWHKFLDLSNDASKPGSARDAYRHCANIVAVSLVSQSFCEARWARMAYILRARTASS